jgi:hypothetical protein
MRSPSPLIWAHIRGLYCVSQDRRHREIVPVLPWVQLVGELNHVVEAMEVEVLHKFLNRKVFLWFLDANTKLIHIYIRAYKHCAREPYNRLTLSCSLAAEYDLSDFDSLCLNILFYCR